MGKNLKKKGFSEMIMPLENRINVVRPDVINMQKKKIIYRVLKFHFLHR